MTFHVHRRGSATVRIRTHLSLLFVVWLLSIENNVTDGSSSSTSPTKSRCRKKSSPNTPSITASPSSSIDFTTRITGEGSRFSERSIFYNVSKAKKKKTGHKLFVERMDEGSLHVTVGKKDGSYTCLCISPSTSSSEVNVTLLPPSVEARRKSVAIEGVYGVYDLPSGWHVVLIVKSEPVFHVEHLMNIRRVVQMEMVRLSASDGVSLSPLQRKEEEEQLHLLRKSLRDHTFYYVPQCTDDDVVRDMTNTLQRSFLLPNQKNNALSSLDSRFFWNELLIRPLLRNTTSSLKDLLTQEVIIPCTSAYIGIQTDIPFDPSTNYTQILISRRSKYRAGTRFTRRGSDPFGNVANYAETEQILLLPGKKETEVYAHVQIRGSIPLRWSSPPNVRTYTPRVYIEFDPMVHARALRNHLTELWSVYGSDVTFLNLIDRKGDQGRLGSVFDSVLRAVVEIINEQLPSTAEVFKCQHLWFDFHAECKTDSQKQKSLVRLLLHDLQSILNQQHFLSVCLYPPRNTLKNKKETRYKIHSLQKGTIRTNCMDCLDRTNVIQSMIARYTLFQQFHTRIASPVRKRFMPLEYIPNFKRNDPLRLPWREGEFFHRNLWADNADHISTLYAGTDALKGDYTRYGKRTTSGQVKDGVNSLTRFYKNNFHDAKRQIGIDLLVGERAFVFLDYDEDGMGEDRHYRLDSLSSHHLHNCTALELEKPDQQAGSSAVRRRRTRPKPWILGSALEDRPMWVSTTSDDEEPSEQKAVVSSITSHSGTAGVTKIIASFFMASKFPAATACAALGLFIPGLISSLQRNGSDDEGGS